MRLPYGSSFKQIVADRIASTDEDLSSDRALDVWLVRHDPHAAINSAVADRLAGKTIKAVLQIGN